MTYFFNGVPKIRRLYLCVCMQLGQLLGSVGNLKGMTSESVASECVLKSYEQGEIHIISKSEPQLLHQFSAHFISNTDQPQACNFASFLPSEEDTPLQVCLPLKNDNSSPISILVESSLSLSLSHPSSMFSKLTLNSITCFVKAAY